jgi:alpha-tubulin suppressor-like RCC1 family protein
MIVRSRAALALVAAAAAAFAGGACTLSWDRTRLCDGCNDGVQCLPGDQPAACGSAGEACVICRPPYGLCYAGSCTVPAPVIDIATAETHSCAVIADGRALCWGGDISGAIGDGPPTDSTLLPTPVLATADFRRVVVGGTYPGSFSCGLTTGDVVRCWGRNGDAQLGIPAGSDEPAPIEPPLPPAIDIGVAGAYGCAVSRAGALQCWGYHSVIDLPAVAAAAEPPGWAGVTTGGGHACAWRESGELDCWGENDHGQLGLGDTAPRATPVIVGTGWARAVAGDRHTCGTRLDGAVYCFGAADGGRLGIGPVESDQLSASDAPMVDLPEPASDLCAAEDHSCAIAGGRLYCWGGNAEGQLGLGTTEPSDVPMPVGDETDWVRVACSGAGSSSHTCATKRDGRLLCWGSNSSGQIAAETFDGSHAPVVVALP